jgi:thioredoxin-like negative regulator of GroEL
MGEAQTLMANYTEVNASDWASEVLKSNMLTVVYFWHDQCPWCIRLNPIFNDVTEIYRGKIEFVKLNVLATPENRELASSQGVMGTPTLMFFCQGRPLGQTVSFMSKEDLEKVMDDMLERYKRCLTQSSDLRNYVV